MSQRLYPLLHRLVTTDHVHRFEENKLEKQERGTQQNSGSYHTKGSFQSSDLPWNAYCSGRELCSSWNPLFTSKRATLNNPCKRKQQNHKSKEQWSKGQRQKWLPSICRQKSKYPFKLGEINKHEHHWRRADWEFVNPTLGSENTHGTQPNDVKTWFLYKYWPKAFLMEATRKSSSG